MPVENDISHIKSFVGIIVFGSVVLLFGYLMWRRVLKERALELRRFEKKVVPIFTIMFVIAVILGLRSIVVGGTEIQEPIETIEKEKVMNSIPVNLQYIIGSAAICAVIALLPSLLLAVIGRASNKRQNPFPIDRCFVNISLVLATALPGIVFIASLFGTIQLDNADKGGFFLSTLIWLLIALIALPLRRSKVKTQ